MGYSLRNPKLPYNSLVIHTTNGRKGTTFTNEVNYLLNSPNVSAHYVVSKEGVIVQMLEPSRFMAWHTGTTKDLMKYGNPYAIGVEVHYTPGEGLWTGKMWEAITFLARKYDALEKVTHRDIAVPVGRKIDPSGVTDRSFLNWVRDYKDPYSLYTPTGKVNIRERPTRQSKIIATIDANFPVFSYTNNVVTGEVVDNSDKWRYVNFVGYILDTLLIPTME